MKKQLVLIACLFASMSGISQKKSASDYASVITGENLKKHLTIIAADDMQGRETGTEGQRKAATYIEQQFIQLGLKKPQGLDGYQQFFPLHKDSIIGSSMKIGTESLFYGNDYTIPMEYNESGAFNAKEIVFAGYGIDDPNYNDYDKLDVKGKVVLIFFGEPKLNNSYFLSNDKFASDWSRDLSKKIKAAADHGAVGVLITRNTINNTLRKSGNNSVYFVSIEEPQESNIPLVQLTTDACRKIMGADFDVFVETAQKNKMLNEMRKTAVTDISFQVNKWKSDLKSSNVLGIIEGSDKKDEYVFLTAHYDHLGMRNGIVYNGADDDGSGTCAVIQMATAFAKAKKEGNGPRRTLVFMTVSGEEKGLWGSEYYTDHPIYSLEKTTVDLNTDMIGRVDTERKKADTLNYVYVVGHDKISSELPIINEGANNKYTKLTLDYKFDDPKDPERIYYRSDHYNFARKGVPVLFFYDGMLKADYHKPTDDVDKINFPLYEKRARMIFHTAWEMANRDEMLKRDKPLPASAW